MNVSPSMEFDDPATIAWIKRVEETKRAEIASLQAAEADGISINIEGVDPEENRSVSHSVSDLLEGIVEQALQLSDHQQVCTETFCRRCARWQCHWCMEAPAPDEFVGCESCRVQNAVRDLELPRRYEFASLYSDVTIARVKNRVAVEASKKVKATDSAVWSGAAGLGKSTLLAATANKEAARAAKRQRRFTVLWTTAIALEAARRKHPFGTEDDAELVIDAMTTPLLALDDLGAESPRGRDVIAEVIHERHDQNLPTWLTTALTPLQIGERYSGGVERRIFEHAIRIDCGRAK